MALPLNGTSVFAPSLSLNALTVSDCTINAIKVDSGDKKVVVEEGVTTKEPITPSPKNLPIIPNGAWSVFTEPYANFNGDLEAGPTTFYGQTIDGIALRRTSNRTNFSYWEDIKVLKGELLDNDMDAVFNVKDKAIESGVWYKYAIQPMSGNKRGSLHKTTERGLIFDDTFLLGEHGKQLNLKFDFAVSSIRVNKKEARIETLGSKYPFISRNGAVSYREFPMSGLITHFMDETKEFAPRAELFLEESFEGGATDMTEEYDALFRSSGVNDYNNTTLEREFREKVHTFLTDGKPKLFKSPKVGNILVRLMDVNLSARQEINGGMIYTFSCNAIEIDEPSIENLDKYNIQKR